MNVASIASALQSGLVFVQSLTPLAALGGPVGVSVGAIVSEVDTFAQGVLGEIQNAGSTLSTDDVATLTAAIASLQSANAILAAQVAAS
jgi:hypothetical protein